MAKLRFEELEKMAQEDFDRLLSVMRKKNHDYTSASENIFANFEASVFFGVEPAKGILLRMGDKMKRIQSFAEQGELKVEDEGVEDAILDLHGYLVLLKGMIVQARLAAEVGDE
jgi:hypothetical protein